MDASIGNCSRIISFYFLIVIFAGLLQNSDAVACRYCNKDFKKVGSHSYRCTARITSPRPLSQRTDVPSPSEPAATYGDLGREPAASSTTTNLNFPLGGHSEIKCVCGTSCKGKRGLRAHQRFCKHLQNSTPESEKNDENDDTSSNNQNTEPTEERDTGESVYNNFKYKPGLKLPSKQEDWNLANTYFHSTIDIKSIHESTNLDQTVFDIQNKVYSYFESTFGTMPSHNSEFENKYQNYSNSMIKTRLRALKKNIQKTII